eukprot:CAMPEP_0172739192 /NCGR_PEP_ID=MMETSP1074-20121228/122017_1 /TAXON_ID=2916 /ORGANISM="Ceratium fusus, Strain PA161109" /LENGTH=36 /DNA_ID= /DNA_START= /DNA_END= /DNA_ORIENTATION=
MAFQSCESCAWCKPMALRAVLRTLTVAEQVCCGGHG